MFELTNVSNNPLPLSDGKSLAPGDSRKMKTVGDREPDYQDRGWLQITEEKKEEGKK
jgi:hypothetical protein